MDRYYRGTSLSVWFLPGAQASLDRANSHIREDEKAQMPARLSLLADQGKLSYPGQINSEGNGISAVKTRAGLRAYGWFDSVEDRKAFIVSHFAFKNRQKADPAELKKALNAKTERDKQATQAKKSEVRK